MNIMVLIKQSIMINLVVQRLLFLIIVYYYHVFKTFYLNLIVFLRFYLSILKVIFMISYNLYKTSIVGHFAHKNVPVPEIGETVELKIIEDSKYKNHIGAFNMNDEMIGSVVANLKKGDIDRGCENNDSLIDDVRTCNRMHFQVIEVVPYCSDVIIVIQGAFFAPIEEEQKPEEQKLKGYLASRWNRSEASKQFGIVVKNQGYIGNNVITVTLGGYGKNPFKKDGSGNNLPQWSWKDESDGLHKWGPSSKALNTKIAEARASSGDKVSISFKDGWIVKKL